eukprot:g2777.t1
MTTTRGRFTEVDSLHAEEAEEIAHEEGFKSEVIDSHGYVEEEGHDYVGRQSYHFGRNLYYITSYDLEPRGPVDEAQLWFIVYHYGGKPEDILVFDADEPAGSWVSYTNMFGESATPETTSLHAHSSSTTNNPMLYERQAKARQDYTDMMGKSQSAPRCATSCTIALRILALVLSLAIFLGILLWMYRSIRAILVQLLGNFPNKLLPNCCPRSSLRHRYIVTATQGRREKLVLLLCAVVIIGAGGMFTGDGGHLHVPPLDSLENDAQCILLDDAMGNRVQDICRAELLSVKDVSPGSLIQSILTNPIAKVDFVKATGFTATPENVFRQTISVLEVFLALLDNYIENCKISEAEPVCSAGICSTKCSSDADCALGSFELSGPYAGVGGWNIRNATCSTGGFCKFAPPASILDSCNAFPGFPFAFATGCAAMMAVSSLFALLRGLREVRTRLPPVILTPAYRMWLANPYKEYTRNFGLRSGIYFWQKVLLTALTQNVLQFILLTTSVSRMSISEFISRAVSIMLGLIILPIITIIRGRMSHPRIAVTVAEIITKLVFFILNSMTRRSIDIIHNDDYRKLQTLATLVPVVSLLRKLYSLSRLLLIRYIYADTKGTINEASDGHSRTATRWRTVETLCAHSLILLGFVFGSVSITRVLSADAQCSSVTPLWNRMSPQILHPDGIFANSRCGWEHVKNVRLWQEGDPIISDMLGSAEASSGRNVEHPWDKMRVSVLNLSADAQLQVLPEVVMAQQCLRQDAGGEVGLPCPRRASEEGGEEDAMPTFCKKMNFKDSPTFSERSTNVARFLASYLSDTLEDLRLPGTDLRTLPKELSSLKHLTLLDIRDNPSLRSVYPALQGLSHLRSENLLADTWRKEHSWNISRAGVTDDTLQRLLTYALPEATKIDLSHNLLESVDSTIREVSISHGKSISRLSLDDNSFIGYYDLGKNGSGISEYLPSLRTLDFNNMRQIQTPQLAENPQFFVDLNRSDLTLSVENVEANTFVFLFYFSSAALRQFSGLSNVGVVLDGVIQSGSSPFPLRYEQSPPVPSGSIYADDFCSGIHFPEKMQKIILYHKPRYRGSDREGFRRAGCKGIDRQDEVSLSQFPNCISQMSNLTFLQLQNIQFGSSLNLTALLGGISRLTSLTLHQTCHSEHLPGDIFLRLKSLKHLEIRDNNLNAPLLRFPSALTSLEISRAGFSRLPKVNHLTDLLELTIHDEHLTLLDQSWGSNPQLTKLRKLKMLSIQNLARGTSAPFAVSNELFTMPHLSSLELRQVVHGTLQPKMIGGTAVLRRIQLIGNANLTGNLFLALHHCSSTLEDLRVVYNGFSGQIGPEIGQFKNLRQLHLNETKLSGPLPQELLNLASSLRTLQLGGHGLEGKVCHDFMEQFSEIEKLWLQSAHFSGECFLANHAELTELDLSGSNFSGPFPSLRRSQQLTHMSLRGNAFRGPIPEAWASLRKLEYLDLSSLDLSNNDVDIFGNWTDSFDGMRRLNISRNRIDDSAVASSLLANMRGLHSLAIDLHLLKSSPPGKAAERDAIDAVAKLHALEFLEIFSPAAFFSFRRTQLPQETLQIVLCNFVKCTECQEGKNNCWV